MSSHSIVVATSVAIKDIAPYSNIVGSPGKLIRKSSLQLLGFCYIRFRNSLI